MKTNIVASQTLQNGNIIGLSDTNSQNKEFEAFKAKFEAVKEGETGSSPKNLQDFLIKLSNS